MRSEEFFELAKESITQMEEKGQRKKARRFAWMNKR